MHVALVSLDEDATAEWAVPAGESLGTPVTGLAGELVARGYDVSIVTMSEPTGMTLSYEHESSARLDVLRVGHRENPPNGRLDALCTSLRARRPDLIHAFGAAAGRVAERVARSLRVPWVWTRRDGAPAQIEGTERFCPAGADRIIVSTSWEVDALARDGVPREKCDVVPLSIVGDVRGSYLEPSIANRASRIATVADDTGEGLADLVRALPNLPAAHLTVAWQRTRGGTSAALADLRVLGAQFHVADRISVLPDATPSRVHEALCRADLVAYTPRRDPSLRVVSAAMACGVPALVTSLGGTDELVEHGVTGLCIPPGDPRRIASAVRILDDAPEVRSSMSRASRKRARELFDQARIADGTLESYAAAGAPVDVAVRDAR